MSNLNKESGFCNEAFEEEDRFRYHFEKPPPRFSLVCTQQGSLPLPVKCNEYDPSAPVPSTESTGSISKESGGWKDLNNPIDSNGPEEEGDRDTWDNPVEFLLSCISMSVGLGNVWRFPGIAARNGGCFLNSVFGCLAIDRSAVIFFRNVHLIPKNTYSTSFGFELSGILMCLGQFSRYGQVKVWNMAPLFKGVGYGSITGVICVVSYYCSLMSLTIYYFFASFAKELPWSICDAEAYGNETCSSPNVTPSHYAQLYYDRVVFPQLNNINDGLGSLHWKLALCLALSWILIFLSLVKGVKSSGKVAYFTAIFPYVVLFILLIRGVTLDGAVDGILYFIKPQWAALMEPRVWYAAVEQCFFSLSTGFGPIIMFSSYNPFKQNVYKDVLIISFMDTFTSLLAGFTVFAVMGNLASKDNTTDISEIVQGGPGLAFILYPQAIASFDWVPQLFAVLFFLMLFTLGVGSATSLTGGVITIICDQFPHWKRWIVTTVVCICGCLLGLMYVTEGGLFMLDLIDHYGAGFIVYVMAMLECVGVSYVYGLQNFCTDIHFMLDMKVGIYWRLCWGVIIPIGLFANLVYYLITESEYTSGGVPYPKVATVCGWALTGFAACLIPVWAIQAISTRKATSLFGKIIESTQPTARWGPKNSKLRQEWLQFRSAAEQSRGTGIKRVLKIFTG